MSKNPIGSSRSWMVCELGRSSPFCDGEHDTPSRAWRPSGSPWLVHKSAFAKVNSGSHIISVLLSPKSISGANASKSKNSEFKSRFVIVLSNISSPSVRPELVSLYSSPGYMLFANEQTICRLMTAVKETNVEWRMMMVTFNVYSFGQSRPTPLTISLKNEEWGFETLFERLFSFKRFSAWRRVIPK